MVNVVVVPVVEANHLGGDMLLLVVNALGFSYS